MIGLIHRVLFDLIQSSAGPEAVEEVKRRAAVPPDKYFGINEVYDDQQWQRIFGAVCEVLDVSPSRAEDLFADHFLADALKRWPTWFQMTSSARELMLRQPVIHNSLATGVQDPEQRKAIQDKFRVESRDGDLITHYCSPNRLCGLYIALVRRVLVHYGEVATVEETQCMKRGDGECVIHTRWASKENRP